MGILDLPDEILIQILLYNNHDALLDLEGVGDRFAVLLGHSSLWRNVQYRSPVSLSTLKTSLKYMGSHSRSLRITGNLKLRIPANKSNITDDLLKQLKTKCSNLTSLALDHVFVDKKTCTLTIEKLPGSLTRLELDRCDVPVPVNGHRFLSHNLSHLSSLAELSVSNCSWLSLQNLVACLGVQTLRKLSFVNCADFSLDTRSQDASTDKDKLGAPGYSLHHLDLVIENCGLNDTLVASINPNLLSRVDRLSLAGNAGLTDRGILIFTQRNRNILKHLDLEGIWIHPARSAELRKKFPTHCQIIHADPPMCSVPFIQEEYVRMLSSAGYHVNLRKLKAAAEAAALENEEPS